MRIKTRRGWRINPKTRVKESAKVYSRKKAKALIKKSLPAGRQGLIRENKGL